MLLHFDHYDKDRSYLIDDCGAHYFTLSQLYSYSLLFIHPWGGPGRTSGHRTVLVSSDLHGGNDGGGRGRANAGWGLLFGCQVRAGHGAKCKLHVRTGVPNVNDRFFMVSC